MNKTAGIVVGLTLTAVAAAAVMLWPAAPANPTDAVDRSANAESPASAGGIFDTDADPVMAAVAQVSGDNPMAGIMALRNLSGAVPPNVEAILWLGKFSIQSQQLDKARERFAEVLVHEPGHLEATWELAMLDMEQGQLDQAVVGFETCFDADEAYANGLFFAGRCYRMMGNNAGAVASFKQYLAFAPDTIVANKVAEYIQELEAEING